MMLSGQIQRFGNHDPLVFQGREPRETGAGKSGLKNSIPARYQDGVGGVDLEQVRRDQRRARSRVMRAAIGQLKRLQQRR